MSDITKYNQFTLNQLQTTYKIVDEIIEELDGQALMQMFQGSDEDTEKLIDILVEETNNAIHATQGQIKNSSFGYLDKLVNSLDDLLKKYVLNYFTITSMPDFEMNWHHVEWGSMVQIYQYLCIEAARGHGKSYFFSKNYPLWKLYRYEKGSNSKSVNKEFTFSKNGQIITGIYDLGKRFMSEIKTEIEINPVLNDKLFPKGRDEGSWGALNIKCKNGAELEIKSIDSRLRGAHPGWIVCDDILQDNQLESSEQRDKMNELFDSVIMNMILPEGQVIVVGTPFHELDLYGKLKAKKKWKVFEYPTIFPDGTFLWESRHGLEYLQEKIDTLSTISFSRELLCKPISSESTIFPYYMLEKCFASQFSLVQNHYSFPKKFDQITVGCDFAISGEVGADYTVYVTLGIDGQLNNCNYYIMNIWREKGVGYNQQLTKLKELKMNFEPKCMMCEDNNFQKIIVDMAKEAGLPVIGHTTTTNKYDLVKGLPGLALLFEQGRIKIPRGDQYSKDMTDMLINELISIAFTSKGLKSVSGHDDIAFALWKAILGANHSNNSFDFTFI